MVFLFMFFFSIAAIVLSLGYKEPASRWLGYALIFAGLGGFGTSIRETLLPYLHFHSLSTPVVDLTLETVTIVSSYASNCLLPFSALMFGLYYCKFLDDRIIRQIRNVAWIPALLTLGITPLAFPTPAYDFSLLLMWAGPYELSASLLLFACIFTAADKQQQRLRLLHFILLGIPLLFDLVFGYLTRAMAWTEWLHYNSWPAYIMLVIFLAGSVSYALVGIKINIQRQSLSQSFRMMTSGTSIINHAVKNEISKIKFLLELSQTEPEQREAHRQMMRKTCDHILEISQHIKERTGNFELDRQPHLLNDIINEAIAITDPLFMKKQVQVTCHSSPPVPFHCDRIHLLEALKSLLSNAAEAIEHQHGQISISLIPSKRNIVLRIEDNGVGIPQENIDKILEPFFTTKNFGINHGLGLSYANTVVQKHGGRLNISSQQGIGTTITAFFRKAHRAE